MSSSSRTRIALWNAAGMAELQCQEIRDAVLLRDGAVRSLDGAEPNVGGVILQIADPLDGVVAVVYVGDSSDGQVALNGVPLGFGMHAIRATDRLDVGTHSYWLSEDLTS
jgi:hypothetical protein